MAAATIHHTMGSILLKTSAQFCFLLFSYFGVLSLAFPDFQNYKPYFYDNGVSQFTPDGRLLQVEYAMNSAVVPTSTPIVFVSLTDELLMIACLRRVPSSQPDVAGMLQERLVLVPTGSMVGTTADSSKDPQTVVVSLSGVLSDCFSLLERVQDARMSWQQLYGGNVATAVYRVAQTIADACEEHACGGGLRPFGATLMVSGLKPAANGKVNEIVVYRTDPSGSIQEFNPTQGHFVVGGSSRVSDSIRRRLDSADIHGEMSPLQKIRRVLNILSNEEHASAEKEGKEVRIRFAFEVVLVSAEKGVFKLTKDQIERIH